ncbi:MAG: dienelactone hydrolase family protein [Gammaproteobacteria bacterium]|jgi:carboxymethylenebutenolidase
MNSLTVTIPTGDGAMGMYTAWPSGDGPFATVVVIMHAAGVDHFTQTMVTRLTEAGYFVAAPDLFHRLDARVGGMLDKLKQLRDPEVESDVNATVDYLQGHPLTDTSRLGIIGFCMGGRVAYLMSALNPRFHAAVAYYGGHIMIPWGDGPSPFSLTERLNCPILYHFGDDDTNPSPEDRQKLEQELTRHGKEHEFYTYAGAGHAFMNFDNADRYREEAARTSWPRTLDFFKRKLA